MLIKILHVYTNNIRRWTTNGSNNNNRTHKALPIMQRDKIHQRLQKRGKLLQQMRTRNIFRLPIRRTRKDTKHRAALPRSRGKAHRPLHMDLQGRQGQSEQQEHNNIQAPYTRPQTHEKRTQIILFHVIQGTKCSFYVFKPPPRTISYFHLS